MQAQCRKAISEDGLARRACYEASQEYYGAVYWFADGAYETAQACMKSALKRDEQGLWRFVREVRSRVNDQRTSSTKAVEAANFVKGRPNELRTRIADDMTSLRASTNEIALYNTLLQSSSPPPNATPAQIIAHRQKLTRSFPSSRRCTIR